MWHPGRTATTKKGIWTLIVTCIDAMTGFAVATLVDAHDSEMKTSNAVFTAFFTTHGILRLVIIDWGSKLTGALQALCQNITSTPIIPLQRQLEGDNLQAIPQIYEQGPANSCGRLQDIPGIHVWQYACFPPCKPEIRHPWVVPMWWDHTLPPLEESFRSQSRT